MRFPRVRLTVRQLMAAVACLAGAGCAGKDPWLTTYRAFTGRGAFFEPPFDAKFAPVWWADPDGTKHYQTEPANGLGIAAFTDGPANTLMVVEAAEAVPWTRPEGLPVDP